MSAQIVSLNLNPNIEWWIKVGPDAGQGLVEFFTSKADRDAGTNRIAYGTFAFGSAVEVTLSFPETVSALMANPEAPTL